VRSHKMALQAQRQFWQALLHDTIHYSTVAQAMYEMQHAETRAFGVRCISRLLITSACQGHHASDCVGIPCQALRLLPASAGAGAGGILHCSLPAGTTSLEAAACV
jgi:hypothetical protein